MIDLDRPELLAALIKAADHMERINRDGNHRSITASVINSIRQDIAKARKD